MTSRNMQHDSESWTLVDIDVACDDADLVSDFLWQNGVAAVEVLPHELPDRELLRTSVGDDPAELLKHLAQVFPTTTSRIVHMEKSISETWREFVTATYVSDDLVIVPAWITPPNNKRILRIEPFDTFGLGNHPTTTLALRLALTHIPERARVFDFGTGSGVLAVGLAKFRQCSCVAFDIAGGSQKALTTNAALNDVTSVQWCEGFPEDQVEAILANILAPVLIDEAHNIERHLKPGGVVILSGMRIEQADKVLRQYRNFTEVARDDDEGWVAIVLRKNSV